MGVVKPSNKNIKRILRKIVDNHMKWHEKLSFALLGYLITMRTSTGATSYMLVYNTEVVIPAEVEIPSLRVIQEAKLDDAEWIRVKQEQLMLIDEKRMDAVCHGRLYHIKIASVFKKKGEALPVHTGAVGLEETLSPRGGSQRKVHTKLARSLHGSLSVVGRSSNLGRNGWMNQHKTHQLIRN
nr:uncharacterized protein LOC117277282 [Nicotiana tomentosiformis]